VIPRAKTEEARGMGGWAATKTVKRASTRAASIGARCIVCAVALGSAIALHWKRSKTNKKGDKKRHHHASIATV
jgi:hypothetical protein